MTKPKVGGAQRKQSIHQWAVKRGRCLTLFHRASAAYAFWRAYCGSVLLVRRQNDCVRPWEDAL